MANITKQHVNGNVYGQWLQQFDWDYFCTFTTQHEMTLPSIRRAMEGYWEGIAKGSTGRLFWGAEPFELKDGFHCHALLKVPPEYSFSMLTQLWRQVSGAKNMKNGKAYCKLLKYNKSLGAGHYCTKYITKGLSDWDILEK